MRKVLLATYLGSAAALAAGSASANDELIKMSQNPKDWVIPAGDYANTRYSKLNQINTQNVGKLQVAWTFSTGVLRGHEGGPLIIGNMMYVHTPFPNKVYALDLSQENKIVWKYEPKQDPNVIPVMCCDTVNCSCKALYCLATSAWPVSFSICLSSSWRMSSTRLRLSRASFRRDSVSLRRSLYLEMPAASSR